ncbi:MAG TPA: ATP-binding protein [Longimicrobium sp.]|jgi:ATP-dependent DNA helicase RecG|nr:ATP-binding protein [Longimicrobium sp.]
MNPKLEQNARALMERAVEVMHESVDEARDDGKACPRVGAVLMRPDGSVHTASRGELRDGDHAEYTLLERKNRDAKLDGAMLFATLEPCAPGARRHPKLGCAERIVLARIKQVWVGIEDPDPTVARKGIEHLRRHGVQVHMFDPDLQEVIREANRDFLEGALQRAAHADAPAQKEERALSRLEDTSLGQRLTDFSDEALIRFSQEIRVPGKPGSVTFNRTLMRMGLLKESDGAFVPTGFGMLLFGRNPQVMLPQARVLGTMRRADGSEEIRDFDGPLVDVPDQVLTWLNDKLPDVIDRTRAVRHHPNDALQELVRESIVNALVHRDYGIVGAKIQLEVTPETIVVRSPGRPVEPITVDQMQAFEAPMLSRNPVLHYVFRLMGLAEERGLGLRSLKRRAQELGLPLPRYTWEDPYLVLTLYREAASAAAALPEQVRRSLSAAEITGWQWLTNAGRATTAEYAEAMQVEQHTARRHLNHLVELGLIRRTGRTRGTTYDVL